MAIPCPPSEQLYVGQQPDFLLNFCSYHRGIKLTLLVFAIIKYRTLLASYNFLLFSYILPLTLLQSFISPGRKLNGIHFAMNFLSTWQSNQMTYKDKQTEFDEALLQSMARDKHVVVIGGGDTGNDCIGTSLRQVGCSLSAQTLVRPPLGARRGGL